MRARVVKLTTLSTVSDVAVIPKRVLDMESRRAVDGLFRVDTGHAEAAPGHCIATFAVFDCASAVNA
jgi:hypothetical protein